ncbi:hypothetical protein ACMA5I_15395 [Paracoccaceae bacterium GXU_MW_L88]
MAVIAEFLQSQRRAAACRLPAQHVECISIAKATTAAIVEVSALLAFATAGAASRLLPMLKHM